MGLNFEVHGEIAFLFIGKRREGFQVARGPAAVFLAERRLPKHVEESLGSSERFAIQLRHEPERSCNSVFVRLVVAARSKPLV